MMMMMMSNLNWRNRSILCYAAGERTLNVNDDDDDE